MTLPGPNPLLAPWTGPFGGLPPFAHIRVEDFPSALVAAMDEKRREINEIAANPSPPTFENTVEALESAGRTWGRVRTLYRLWSGARSDEAFRAVERDFEPRIAAFEDEILLNERLFARLAAVHDAPERTRLAPEQQRLLWRYHTRFVRAGARLGAAKKQRLAAINQRLAGLYTTFSQNVLADEEADLVLLDADQLGGLPPSVRDGAAALAVERGHPGRWAVANTRSSVEPFLTYATDRALRERVFRGFVRRGDKGDAHDTKATITEILTLRAERARLLGYATHAHWRLEDSMAGTPERAQALLDAVWAPAVARVREEVADMQAIAEHPIAPWDYRFYAEKVRKARYDLDQNELKPYLQLENLREGMFWVAGELFDLIFHPLNLDEVEVYHPDVRVWEVRDRHTGGHVGLWYFDPYARAGKQSGAWMDAWREQSRYRGEETTLVSNNANFVKPAPGQPVLISWEDARTLFHEFGHALHGLCSNVRYPSLSGTSVVRDYVEFPSQLLESWLSCPEVLRRFALHVETGAPIPQALVDRLNRAEAFNQGFRTVETLAAAQIDLKLHLSTAASIDPDTFERQTLAALGMPSELVMRHRTPHFAHVFAGDDYSAGYYSYLWADTLSTDAYEAFLEAGGPFDREVAARLLRHVFSAGDTVDPAVAYRAFRGRDASPDALMRRRGFTAAGAAP